MKTRKAEALLDCDTADPHGILGAHPVKGGVVVRALRPGADSVELVRPRAKPVALECVHSGGLFEGTLKGAKLPLRYELRARYPDGAEHLAADPYAFLPTLGDLDLHLIGEGRHHDLHDKLGAHVRTIDGVEGTAFAVWAPNARSASVVGDFNLWDGRHGLMRSLGSSGVWELFVPGAGPGQRYKFELRTHDGTSLLRADPFARETEMPPQTASVIAQSEHRWADEAWMAERAERDPLTGPMSIYEVHLGSWRLNPDDGNRRLTYRELADELAAYVSDLGFTHVQLMPVMAHPFSGSWGYQVTSQFAPTPRHGSPDDLRELCDQLHQHGIGVIMDWVPAHFPRDEWALARFDGTALFEHDDPRRGAHPDWGTLIFNFGRAEVRNFLVSSAVYWLRDFHADGLRVDAVASMLYLDYSRKEGEWVPNAFGGREDLDAVGFLRELNEVTYGAEPGVTMVAEESTAWPGVSRPTYTGGLGFGFKWNLGWMHDTLEYFSKDPIHRRYHHHELTFSMMYAYSENFVLPLSHDEVVHGKGSLLSRMPGDRWQQLANLRALYGYMWAHPGKKLLFMGGEFAQESEWRHDASLDWHLLEDPGHAGVQRLIGDLNRLYRKHPALWATDASPEGFWWLEANDTEDSVLAWCRADRASDDLVVCVANLTPVPRPAYRLGLPGPGRWREAINTDSDLYGGSNVGNYGVIDAESVGWQHQPWSAMVTLPPLSVLWLVREAEGEPATRPGAG